ncbi:MAG TPA: hypothetical protein DDW19_04525, partial [Anaerolineaceae bacterium]|nr:hypothetical protein [Anaerolineaceae bacterium]
LMNPCPIRDHNADLRQLIRKHEVEPIDQNSAAALQDASYAAGMDHYDAEYQKIVDRVWQEVYLKRVKASSDRTDVELERVVAAEKRD